MHFQIKNLILFLSCICLLLFLNIYIYTFIYIGYNYKRFADDMNKHSLSNDDFETCRRITVKSQYVSRYNFQKKGLP